MSPITLALAGLLAYRTYHGQGRLADLLGRAGVTGMPGMAGAGSGATPGAPGAQGHPGAPGGASPQGGTDFLGELGRMFQGGNFSNIGNTLSTGLDDLMRRFQESGRGATAQSWVSTGSNQPIAPSDLEAALGSERLDWLQQQTGMSREELLRGLSKELPEAVDKLTPDGRVPNPEEASRIVREQPPRSF